MDPFITQCPQCQTAFRVTPEQIEMAGGSVRCGSCMHIFQAEENRFSEPAASHSKPVDESRYSYQDPTEDLESDDIDIDFDFDANLPADDDEATFPGASPSLQTKASSSDFDESFLKLDEFEEVDAEAETNAFDDLDNLESNTQASTNDDEWANDLLTKIEANVENNSFEEDEFAGEYAFADEDSPSLKPDEEKPEEEKPGDFELPISGDSGFSPDIDATPFNEPDEQAVEDAVPVTPTSTKVSDPFDDIGALIDKENLAAAIPAESQAQIISQINPPPIQMTVTDSPVERAKKYLWMSAIALAVLSMGLQNIWFNKDELAANSSYRPWIESGCKILNCKVAPQKNLKQIRASNLVVRSHPSHKNVLIVDAIVTNQASYQQPFPILELVFSDVTGDVTASRKFLPGEYLQGELSGVKKMKQNQPIHLSLEIVDPGPTANSYSMRLHASATL